MKYDVIIIGAGPGGIFSAYELLEQNKDLKIAVFEAGAPLEKRRCPIDGDKVKTCIKCKTCAIMSGFGGAGAFSDGKYNITNDFGGTLYEYIGKKTAIELMEYVDSLLPEADEEELKADPNLDDLRKFLYIENARRPYCTYEELTRITYHEGLRFRNARELTPQEDESFQKAMKEQGISFVY